MINMDDLHFVSGKRKSQFKIKAQIGSFICNTRSTGIEAYTLLKEMNFQPNFNWSYDPFGIISPLGVDLKMTPYNHTPRPEIEKFMNQEQWVGGTLQEAYEQVVSTPIGQTPVT